MPTCAQGIKRYIFNAVSVYADVAAGNIIKTGQQAGNGRFARAGRSDYGNYLTWVNGKGQAVQHFFLRIVGEFYVIKLNLAINRRQNFGIGNFLNGFRQIKYAENTVAGSKRFLNACRYFCKALDRVAILTA